MMTHEDLTIILRQMSDCTYHRDKSMEILAHDQAQRAVIAKLEEYEVTYLDENHKLKEKIEQQAKEIEQWKAAAQMHNGIYEPLQQENKTLREALEKLVNEVNGMLGIEEENLRNLVGNTNINVLNIRIANAQQALKEVS